MPFELAHGLAECGTRDAIAFDEVGLGSEHVTRLPAAPDDLFHDPFGDHLGELAPAHGGVGERRRAGHVRHTPVITA